MNKLLQFAFLFIAIFLYYNYGYAQTVIATESFGTAAAKGTVANGYVGDMGSWSTANTAANGASANEWYVSGEECGNAVGVCGSACPGGDNSLHISALGGLCGTPDCGAAYDETNAANQTNKRAISPTVDCSGAAGIQLSFNYIAAQGDDGFIVEYSLNNGTTWTTFTGGNVAASSCCTCFNAAFCAGFGVCCPPQTATPCTGFEQGMWTAVTLNFPIAADNNPTIKFAFHWSNDGNGVGTDPSVAIDDIVVHGATILDLNLTSFEVNSDDNINHIQWTSRSEYNLSHFELLTSRDGVNFHLMETIEPEETNIGKREYNFYHEVINSDNYYQLKSIDNDGKSQLSEIIYVNNKLDGILLNSIESGFNISGIQHLSGQIQIIDLSGKIVQSPITFSRPKQEVNVDFQQLKSGVYFIQVISNQGRKNFKVYYNPHLTK